MTQPQRYYQPHLIGAALVLVAAVLFFATSCDIRPAQACDSYEDCMELSRSPISEELDAHLAVANQCRAIAYKLDEISKKLDRR